MKANDIKKREISEHPAREDYIEVRNIESELQIIENALKSLQEAV